MNPTDKKDIVNKPQNEDIENKPTNTGLFSFSLIPNKDKNFSINQIRIEKVSAAIYLITNFFPDEENLKWKLREVANKVSDLHITLAGFAGENKVGQVNLLQQELSKLVSFISIAEQGGLFSDMNANILKNQISLISKGVYNETQTSSSPMFSTIKPNFFEVNIPPETKDEFAGKSLINREESKVQALRTIDKSPLPQKEINVVETEQESKGHRNLKEFSPVAIKKNKRKGIIINILKRKREAMINDIMEYVTDCSEKTMQRELADMVRDGVITKRGLRRWTVYSLVN